MKRFKNILAVYNDEIGADDALSHAAALARTNGARLTVADVSGQRYASRAALEERRKRLARLVKSVERDGPHNVEARVLIGTPFLEIVRQVLRADHDIVVAGAEGGSVVRNVFYGSTATHLMRKCPCPVWIVKPDQALPYTRILAAIDPDLDNPTADALSIKIMDLATSLAAANNADLHIVHAWEVEGSDRDQLASEIRDETRHMILSKHEDVHRHVVEALLETYELSDLPHHIHLPRGRPERQITDVVENCGIDLIVMGTVSRTGIPGLLMGNAAESVLAAVRCGVLTVKPEGFETPVRLEETMASDRILLDV